VRLLLAIALLGACKADQAEPPAPVIAERVAAESPLPTGTETRKAAGSGPARAPIATLMPTIDGAKLLGQRTRDEVHAITTLCIDEHDATERVMAALRRDGWSDIRTRGEGERIGVAATKDDARFAASTGSRDERCAGTLVSATVMRLGQVRLPPMPVGDKLR
jgi:hypothetical protein